MLNVNLPFERVKANMVRAKHHLQKMVPTKSGFFLQVAGTHKPCLVSEALENPISGSTDDTVKWMSASLCTLRAEYSLFITRGLM